jgi:WD40 repeat protein
LTALLAGQAQAVPAVLARTTLHAAQLAAAGQVLTGAVTAPVVAAVEEVLRDLLVSRAKFLALVVLGLGVLVAGVGVLPGSPRKPEPPAPAAAPAPPQPMRADEPLPAGAVARLGSLRLRHGNPITCVAHSPDGKLLATGSWDNSVCIWEARTGRLVRELWPGVRFIWALAFSPDGRALATAGDQHSKVARVLDVASGKRLCSFTGHEGLIRAIAYAPDGQTIATASLDGTARLWDPGSGKELLRIDLATRQQLRAGTQPQSVVFSPDGDTLATTDGTDAVRFWDSGTGREKGALRTGQRGLVSAAYWDDGRLMVAGGADGTVWVWELASGRQLHRVEGSTLPALSVAFAPDGRTFAAGYGSWGEGRELLAGEVVT